MELDRDGEKISLPRMVSKTYTLSLGERANLRKDLESWRGRIFTPEELKGFDIQNLIGANCMIQVIHKTKDGKTFANISAILPLYKGMSKVQPENKTTVYILEQGNPPEDTPKWIVERIHQCEEWRSMADATEEYHYEDANLDDDIPF
jgi:hypothetical protein